MSNILKKVERSEERRVGKECYDSCEKKILKLYQILCCEISKILIMFQICSLLTNNKIGNDKHVN